MKWEVKSSGFTIKITFHPESHAWCCVLPGSSQENETVLNTDCNDAVHYFQNRVEGHQSVLANND